MNKKSLLGFFFISLLLASFIFSSNLVLAQEGTVGETTSSDFPLLGEINPDKVKDVTTTSSSDSFTMERFKNLPLVNLWLKGYDAEKENLNFAGEFVKVMLLLLLTLLVYSSMSYANFMHGGIRFVVSVIIGLLATFLISTEALLTSLTSFTALGTAIWIFLPILVLTFFTIMVSSAAAPFGILVQEILWVIYSVYTFISGIVIFSLYQGKTNAVAKFFNDWIVIPLYGKNSALLAGMTKNADPTTAVLLIVVSIVVFWIAVVKGTFLTHWLAKEKMDAEIMKFQTDVQKQSAKRKAEAADVSGKEE